MNDHSERLWQELDDLLRGLDWKLTGPEEAAFGSYGRRIFRKIIQTEMLREDERAGEYCEFLWAGFASLISDYRISEDDLKCMRFAYTQLRRGASAGNEPGTSHGGNSDNPRGNR